MTIFVVFQPSLGAGFKKTAHRAAGTVIAIAIVIVIAIGALLPSSVLLYMVGTGFLMVAFIFMLQGRPYWLYVTVLTAAIGLLESTGSTVDEVAEQRLGATLVAVAGTMLVMLALAPIAKHLTRGPKVAP